jgi:uncharacterized protein YbjT (DUF2867 family)
MIERNEGLVTVFGGDGFIGRYVCEYLFQSGVRVRVASRDPRNSYFIQPLGQVGQFGFVRADITNRDAVRDALKGASAVVNLVGVFGKNVHATHVEGARNIAKIARDCGIDALVHISAIGANAESESAYSRTKAEGEKAVREAFPNAAVIRPSLVFGPDDDFTNRFGAMARWPFLPVIAGKRKFQPVYARDLGNAISMATLDPQRFGGKTYEIGGPEVMSMAELLKAIASLAGQDPTLIPVPDFMGSLLSYFGWLPGAPLTRDQWLMLQYDNVSTGEMPGLDSFDLRPTPLAAVAYEWLDRFRGNRFAGRRIHLTSAN